MFFLFFLSLPIFSLLASHLFSYLLLVLPQAASELDYVNLFLEGTGFVLSGMTFLSFHE